jgi:hypothetical protein
MRPDETIEDAVTFGRHRVFSCSILQGLLSNYRLWPTYCAVNFMIRLAESAPMLCWFLVSTATTIQ